MKLFPPSAPSISARSDEWQDWIAKASDIELVESTETAYSQDNDRLRGMLLSAAGMRCLVRTKLSARGFFSPLEVHSIPSLP